MSKPIMSRMDMLVVLCPKWRNFISVSTFTTQMSLGGFSGLEPPAQTCSRVGDSIGLKLSGGSSPVGGAQI